MDAFEAVSLPDQLVSGGRRLFTVSEANRALTLVRRVVVDVVRHYKRLCELHAACRTADAKGDAAEAEQARRQYASVTDRLSELNEELEKIGCELRDYQLGLVDFPAMFQGREVYLCWKLGEEQVSHLHASDVGCAARQPAPEDNLG